MQFLFLIRCHPSLIYSGSSRKATRHVQQFHLKLHDIFCFNWNIFIFYWVFRLMIVIFSFTPIDKIVYYDNLNLQHNESIQIYRTEYMCSYSISENRFAFSMLYYKCRDVSAQRLLVKNKRIRKQTIRPKIVVKNCEKVK